MVKATEPHRPDRDTIGGSTGCRDYPMSTDVTMPPIGLAVSPDRHPGVAQVDPQAPAAPFASLRAKGAPLRGGPSYRLPGQPGTPQHRLAVRRHIGGKLRIQTGIDKNPPSVTITAFAATRDGSSVVMRVGDLLQMLEPQ